MKEQLIEFNTAKLAQEKGFDVVSYLKCNFDLIENSNFKSDGKSSWYLDITQSLLQKWLREVHNIEVEVYREVNFADECYYDTYCVDVYNNKLSFLSKDYTFTEGIDTYEQALEQGLLEGLKLIDNETSTG